MKEVLFGLVFMIIFATFKSLCMKQDCSIAD